MPVDRIEYSVRVAMLADPQPQQGESKARDGTGKSATVTSIESEASHPQRSP